MLSPLSCAHRLEHVPAQRERDVRARSKEAAPELHAQRWADGQCAALPAGEEQGHMPRGNGQRLI